MVSAILNLFGRSPFAPLKAHMGEVVASIQLLPSLFNQIENKDYQQVESTSAKIAHHEHEADLLKDQIRDHLPKSLFLPVDRNHLLDILTLQDRIADRAEDIAVMVTLKQLDLPDIFKQEFYKFLDKNLEAFQEVKLITEEMTELLETSFGGHEADKVRTMVKSVAHKEHEADLLQRALLKKLFIIQPEMDFGSFLLWQKIFESIAETSNLSENLANRIRLTLELK